MADLQTTLSLVLSAKDEASAVFRQVGDQMAKLGSEAEALSAKAQGIGFDVGRPETLKAALDQQIRVIEEAGVKALSETKEVSRMLEQDAKTSAERRIAIEKNTIDRLMAESKRWEQDQVSMLAKMDRERTDAATKRKVQRDAEAKADRDAAMESAYEAADASRTGLRQRDKAGGGLDADELGRQQEAIEKAYEDAVSAAQRTYAQRRALSKELLRTDVEDSRQQKEQETRNLLEENKAVTADAIEGSERRIRQAQRERDAFIVANKAKTTEALASEAARTKQAVSVVGAAGEQQRGADALRGVGDATTKVEEVWHSLLTELDAAKPPAFLTEVTADATVAAARTKALEERLQELYQQASLPRASDPLRAFIDEAQEAEAQAKALREERDELMRQQSSATEAAAGAYTPSESLAAESPLVTRALPSTPEVPVEIPPVVTEAPPAPPVAPIAKDTEARIEADLDAMVDMAYKEYYKNVRNYIDSQADIIAAAKESMEEVRRLQASNLPSEEANEAIRQAQRRYQADKDAAIASTRVAIEEANTRKKAIVAEAEEEAAARRRELLPSPFGAPAQRLGPRTPEEEARLAEQVRLAALRPQPVSIGQISPDATYGDPTRGRQILSMPPGAVVPIRDLAVEIAVLTKQIEEAEARAAALGASMPEGLEKAGTAARNTAQEIAAINRELAISKAPHLDAIAAQLQKVSEEAHKVTPSIQEFEAALREAARGAGSDPGDQFAAVKARAQELTDAIKQGARVQVDAIKAAATEMKQDEAAALAARKDGIRAFYTDQVRQVEEAARQIQALLREAYSAPGMTEAMKAQGQDMLANVKQQSEALSDAYRTMGAQAVQEAERNSQEINRAIAGASTKEVGGAQTTAKSDIGTYAQTATQHMTELHEAMDKSKESVHGLGASFKIFAGELGEPFEKVGMLTHGVQQMFLWNALYPMTGQLVQVIDSLASGLITSNVALEQFSMTLSAVYQLSGPQGIATAQNMTHWLDAFATKVPGTRQQVREAALAFASAGDNVSEILPTASNLGAIMGVDLPKAAQAMIDAQMGRFEMLQVTLHTTKAELEGYGLQVDRTGHVMNNTFVPAIERYVGLRFGEHLTFEAKQVADFHRVLLAAGGQLGTNAQLILNAASIRAGGLDTTDLTGQNRPQRVAHETAQAVEDLASRNTQTQQQGLQKLHEWYGITVQDLNKQGEGWNRTGAAAEAAVAKILAAHYGGASVLMAVHEQQSAIALQMSTLGGAWSNVIDAFVNLQQIAGQGMFDRLHDQVRNLYNLLQSPAIRMFAQELGSLLGNALQHVIDGFTVWSIKMGGLPGILQTVTQWATVAWRIIQGFGDALGMIGAVIGTVFSALGGIFNALGLSSSASEGIRTLAAAVIDLVVAMKVLQVVSAGLGVFTAIKTFGIQAAEDARVATAKEKEAAASRVAATATEQETVALQTQTGVEAENTLTTNELTAAQERLAVAQGSAGLTAGEGAVVGGALGAGEKAAVGTGEKVAAGAGAAAADIGFMEAAEAGIGAMGTAALATLGPFALVVGGFAALTLGAMALKNALDTQTQKEKVQPLLPPPVLPPPLLLHVPANHRLAVEMFNRGIGQAPHPAMSTPEDIAYSRDYAAFMGSLPKSAQSLEKNAVSGTDAALIENERAWTEYLSKNPKVLAKVNALLKEAGKPQMSMSQVQQDLVEFTQQSRGFSQPDVDKLNVQARTYREKLVAAAEAKSPNVVGLLDELRQTTYDTVWASGHTAKEAQTAADAVGAKFWKDWNKWLPKAIDDQLQGTLAGLIAPEQAQKTGYTSNAYQDQIKQAQQLLSDALEGGGSGKEVAQAFDRVRQVAWRGARDASQSADEVAIEMHTAINTIGQNLSSKLKWDSTLDRGFDVYQKDIGETIQGFQKLHVPMDKVAKTLVPIILQQAQQDIPALVKAGPNAINAYTHTLEQELTPLIPDARDRARVIANVLSGTLAAVAQQLQEVFQADITLNDPQAALAQIPALVAQKRKDVGTGPGADVIVKAYNLQLHDTAQQLNVKAAQTQLSYDEQMKAPWSQIVADINVYADALSHTSGTATEHALLVKQAWQTALGTHQQNLELQLQYDQMMQAPYATIVADIRNIGAAMTASGDDFRTVAIKTHDLLVAAAQKEEQTQQTYIQYSETMGESWSVIMSHIRARAGAMASTGAPAPQITLAEGQDIQQAADGLLQNALDTGASFKTAHDIIMEGARALSDAGYSRVAVEKWITTETRKAFDPYLQQAQTAGKTAFDTAMTQGHVQTPAQIWAYVNSQMVLERQKPLAPGENKDQQAIAQQAAQIALIKQGFDGTIGWAQKQFDWDTTGGNAAQALKDENRILALSTKEWTAEGIAPGDRKLMAEMLKYQLDQTRTGGYTRPTEPQYHAYGGLGREPGFGSVIAMFGGPSVSSQMVSILQAQLHEAQQQTTFWQTRAIKDEAQLRASQQTADNTRQTAQGIARLIHLPNGATHPVSAGNPVANARRVGTSLPVPHP